MEHIKVTMGEKIDDILKDRKMTQKQLAEKAGVSPSRVNDVINGKGTTAKTIIGICSALEVSADYLLGLSDVATQDADLKMVCEYTNLSEKAVEAILHCGEIKFINDHDRYDLTRGIAKKILNLFLESKEFKEIMFLLCFGASAYALKPAPGAKGKDAIEAERLALKTGCCILSGTDAAEFYAQSAMLVFQKFASQSLKQFTYESLSSFIESNWEAYTDGND